MKEAENNFWDNENDEVLRLVFFTCVSAIIIAAIIVLPMTRVC